EKASENGAVVAANRYEAIELLRLAGQIAKREDELAGRRESRMHGGEQRAHVLLRFQMQQRVDHADGELDVALHVAREMPEVVLNRANRQIGCVRTQLVEQLAIEIDRGDVETEPRERNGLKAA